MGIRESLSRPFKNALGISSLERELEAAQKAIVSSNEESGSSGLKILSGWVSEAYSRELNWPEVIPLYNRIWRSDPEVAVARVILESLSGKIQVGVEIPEHSGISTTQEKISDDDKKARDFMEETLDDIEGGINGWLISCMTRVPFYGWGWWEVVNGIRSQKWSPPGNDDWRSQYDDGLVGFRKFAFRHYSSFSSWDSDDSTGKVRGLVQLAPPNPSVKIPLNRSLHIKFGDQDNPEGLATMEALWRLERLKYGLEIVQGLGFEHAAGYLDVTATKSSLSAGDKENVAKAARSILTAQEGNYALWPNGFEGKLMDVPFQASTSILEAIRYYGLLKLALLGMQWAALGTLSPYGSNATSVDASSFFLTTFNSMVEGVIDQADQQVGKRLFSYEQNRAAFPGMTRRPRIVVQRKVEKSVKLAEIGQFLQAISAILPIDDEDLKAIRRASEILPDRIPEHGKILAQPLGGTGVAVPGKSSTPGSPSNPNQNPTGSQINKTAQPVEPKSPVQSNPTQMSEELAFRPFTVPQNELPISVQDKAIITERDIQKALDSFRIWAQTNDPELAALLDAKSEDGTHAQ